MAEPTPLTTDILPGSIYLLDWAENNPARVKVWSVGLTHIIFQRFINGEWGGELNLPLDNFRRRLLGSVTNPYPSSSTHIWVDGPDGSGYHCSTCRISKCDDHDGYTCEEWMNRETSKPGLQWRNIRSLLTRGKRLARRSWEYKYVQKMGDELYERTKNFRMMGFMVNDCPVDKQIYRPTGGDLIASDWYIID